MAMNLYGSFPKEMLRSRSKCWGSGDYERILAINVAAAFLE